MQKRDNQGSKTRSALREGRLQAHFSDSPSAKLPTPPDCMHNPRIVCSVSVAKSPMRGCIRRSRYA
eukprot:890501-Pleurochrysis_carterae.AAC.1